MLSEITSGLTLGFLSCEGGLLVTGLYHHGNSCWTPNLLRSRLRSVTFHSLQTLLQNLFEQITNCQVSICFLDPFFIISWKTLQYYFQACLSAVYWPWQKWFLNHGNDFQSWQQVIIAVMSCNRKVNMEKQTCWDLLATRPPKTYSVPWTPYFVCALHGTHNHIYPVTR